jgi:WhiB family redox-sensing transcriptional regulator
MLDNSVFRRPAHAPDTTARPEHWGKHGACRTAPQQIFFPEDFSGAEAVAVAEEAKGYCRRCPVMPECLDEAMQRGERFGVWGGTTAAERRACARREREEARRATTQVVTTKAA